jgi:hypothetical protein
VAYTPLTGKQLIHGRKRAMAHGDVLTILDERPATAFYFKLSLLATGWVPVRV